MGSEHKSKLVQDIITKKKEEEEEEYINEGEDEGGGGGEGEGEEEEPRETLLKTKGLPDHNGTRGSIALSVVPVCYRCVKSRVPVPEGVFMDIQVFQFETGESLKKCPSSHKNQERIFVTGDTVGVVMTFDPFAYDDDVWFIVTRRKNGVKRLWRRKWKDLKTRIASVPSMVCEKVPVFEIGVVGEDPKVRNLASLRDAVCFYIKVGDMSRQNTLWVEMGLFRVWSSTNTAEFESFVTRYCGEVTINMKY